MGVFFDEIKRVAKGGAEYDAVRPELHVTGDGATIGLQVHRGASSTTQIYEGSGNTFSWKSEDTSADSARTAVISGWSAQLEAAHLDRLADHAGDDHITSQVMYSGQSGHAGHQVSMLAVEVGGNTHYIATHPTKNGLYTLSDGSGGSHTTVKSRSDTSSTYIDDTLAMAAARVGSKTFLFAAGQTENGVSAYEISSNGTLTHRASLGIEENVSLTNVTTLATAEVGGTTYLLAGAFGSHAISVMEVGSNGQLSEVSELFDTRASRFGGVSVMEIAEVGGETYVVAGGADDGLALLLLTDDGRLIHLESFEATAAAPLINVNGLAVKVVGETLHIFATSGREPGVVSLTVDFANREVTAAGSGGQALSGGAWGDILADGTGSDTITGGAGADIFVLTADGRTDTITDFQLGEDILDLSAWARLGSLDQISFTTRADGIELRYGAETLILLSALGTSLDYEDFLVVEGIAGVYRPGLPGITQPDPPPTPPLPPPPPMPDQPEPPDDPPPPPDDGSGGSDGDTGGSSGGNDNISGTAGSDILQGGAGNDTLRGLSGNDTLDGGTGSDRLYGDDGRDRIAGGDGNDSLWGGNDNDYLDGNTGNDSVTGGNGNDTMRGGGNNDTLRADNGNDVLWGDGGNDRMYGGNGNDTMQGGYGNDTLWGDAGDDELSGDAGNDVLYGGNDRDTLKGGDGNDILWGDASNDALYGDGGNDKLYGSFGADRMEGGSGNDTMEGGASTDRLWGNDGDDNMLGGTGDDTLYGGAGDDRIFGNTALDTIYGEAGNDYISSGDGRDFVDGGSGNDTIYGRSGWDLLKGGSGNDYLIGSEGDDSLYGGLGNDSISAGSAWDFLYGDGGNDTLYGNFGSDQIDGGANADELYGGTGDDTLLGGSGNDRLLGMQGVDVLEGGRGNDTLRGGTQRDTFIFREGDGRDVMENFEALADVVKLSRDLTGGRRDAGNIVSTFGKDTGKDVQLDFGDGDKIIFEDIANLNDLLDALTTF